MPTAMNFDSLQEDLRRYLERGNVQDTEVYEQLPRLINLAERSIARKLKIQGFIVPVISDLVAGTSVYAKPDRWRDTVSMNFGVGTDNNERTPIFARSYEYCRAYWPNSNLRDVPQFYADYDYNHWLIAPTPIANYPWEVMYYQLPALLDDTNQANWLSNYAPNALLYRSLVEAEPFMKNDERMAVWKGMYDEEMANLDGEDLKKVVDRAGVRDGA